MRSDGHEPWLRSSSNVNTFEKLQLTLTNDIIKRATTDKESKQYPAYERMETGFRNMEEIGYYGGYLLTKNVSGLVTH